MTDSPIVKIAIISVFILILVALGSAFVSLFRGRDREGTAAVKALTVRIALSLGLVLAIVLMNALGIITPNG